MDKNEVVAANLILPLVKDIILPKVQKIFSAKSVKDADAANVRTNLEEYLIRRYEKYSVIDTLVFPNKQTLFKVLYEPLTITSRVGKGKMVNYKLTTYPKDCFVRFERIIIEDTAGMGKSTIVKKIFLSIIEQRMGIPIVIELRHIKKGNEILKEIQSQFSPLGKSISMNTLTNLIDQKEFIFLFDGLDEIPSVDKDFVIKELKEFINKASGNYFVITSRSDDSLTSFGDFQKFHIQPLTQREAFNLIKRYDKFSFKPIAKDLIRRLQKNQYETIEDFLTNPLLTSLLYKSFDYKKNIPLKRTQFYRQVYDALFEAHDLSKEGYLKRDKKSNLHSDDFERVLRYMGYLSSVENKVEYEKSHIILLIEKAKKYTPDLRFKASDYLVDLIESVPLFSKDGNNYRWAHKSFQDYFAATFLWIDAGEDQISILKKMYSDDTGARFLNVLELLYELDSNLFEATFLLWFLEGFERFCEDGKNLMCNCTEAQFKLRMENAFGKACVITVSTESERSIMQSNNAKFAEIQDSYIGRILERADYPHRINYFYYSTPSVILSTHIRNAGISYAAQRMIEERYPKILKNTGHDSKKGALQVLKEGQIYVVDNNVDNIVNSPSIFDQTTELIVTNVAVSYDKAFSKLRELRKQLNIVRKNDLLNW